jgi:hypothetical protein
LKCEKCGTTKPPLFYHIVNYQTMECIRVCRHCHDELHGRGKILVEIFNEYTPIVKGGSQHNKYQAAFVVSKKANPKHITEEDLHMYVEKLKQRYPSEKFYMRKLTWKNKILYVIAKRKNPHTTGRVPLYFDLENQKFYVEKKDLEKNEKLANYIIMVTLGALGVSQSKYMNILARATT